jgi:hypothetical protein
MKKGGASSFSTKTWQWHPPAPISNKYKNKKQRKKVHDEGLAKVANEAQLHLEVTKRKEKKEKKGAWAPFWLRVDDGTHLHPQATKQKEKRKKKRELNFLPRLGDGAPTPKSNKKKEKRGS